jgi:hypothetical protein
MLDRNSVTYQVFEVGETVVFTTDNGRKFGCFVIEVQDLGWLNRQWQFKDEMNRKIGGVTENNLINKLSKNLLRGRILIIEKEYV